MVHTRNRIVGVAEQHHVAGSSASRTAAVDRSRGGVPPSPMYLSRFRDARN